MTAHDHTEYVDGCFRCDLSRDEVAAKVERSSLGTSEAQALRSTVSDEHAAKIVARAKELEHNDQAGKHHPDCPALYFTDHPERCMCEFMVMLDRAEREPGR